MNNPFLEPPVNISTRLTGDDCSRNQVDYLAHVASTVTNNRRLLDSLCAGEDSTIRDGVNLAVSHLLDPSTPRDPDGKKYFLVHDGTGTGKSFQALLAGKVLAKETGKAALVITRSDLVGGLRRDLNRLGLDESALELIATEQLGTKIAGSRQAKRDFAAVILDEAQDCEVPEVRRAVHNAPSERVLFLSASPFHNIEGVSYFIAKLSGRDSGEVRRFLQHSSDPANAIHEELKKITRAGGMIHREFPFFGNINTLEIPNSTVDNRGREMLLKDGYKRLLKTPDPLRRSGLQESLTNELIALADLAKVSVVAEEVTRSISDNRKVVVVGSEIPIASKVLRDHDGLPLELPGFLTAMHIQLARNGIVSSVLEALPVPCDQEKLRLVTKQNTDAMAKFVDGAYRIAPDGNRVESCGPDAQPLYAPCQNRVALLPYQQTSGWSEMNQRFSQAPQISILLTPTSDAKEILQAVGRGSRRNSQGPTEVKLVSNDSAADQFRLKKLSTRLRIIAATGSLSVAPLIEVVEKSLARAVLTNESVASRRVVAARRSIHTSNNQGMRV